MSNSHDRKLTTTGYAILCLLAIKPWSTYELAQQMRRSLHHIWPRAESNVYAEPKRLVEAGLAKAELQKVGERPARCTRSRRRGDRRFDAGLGRKAHRLVSSPKL